MAAASAQVRASCMSDRLSFSVAAFAAQRRASSAYCRNWSDSDIAISWQRPLCRGACARCQPQSAQSSSLNAALRNCAQRSSDHFAIAKRMSLRKITYFWAWRCAPTASCAARAWRPIYSGAEGPQRSSPCL